MSRKCYFCGREGACNHHVIEASESRAKIDVDICDVCRAKAKARAQNTDIMETNKLERREP